MIADDLGDRLACYGDTIAVTPNLDRLAQRGTLFRNTFCQYHSCGPSRASLMSGRYPFETGYRSNKSGAYHEALPELTSLPRLFRENGYQTIRIGKIFHMGVPGGIGSAGADDVKAWDHAINNTGWDAKKENWSKATTWGKRGGSGVRIRYSAPDLPDSEFSDGQGVSDAIALLKANHPDKTGKPFFLAMGFYRPHPPMIAPKKHWDAITPKNIRLPKIPQDDRDDIPKINWHLHDPGFNFIPEKHGRAYTHAYYATIHYIDSLVGRLIETLEEQGLADNTVVVFTGDQGFMLGEHGHWHKSSMLEPSQRVPLIILDPRKEQRGKQSLGLTGLIDVYPTLCDLAGIKPAHELSGVSLKARLENPEAPGKDYELIMGTPGGFTIRTERYHYSEWRGEDGKAVGAMLYDMEADPGQFNNRMKSPEHEDIIDKLRQLLETKLSTNRGSQANPTNQ